MSISRRTRIVILGGGFGGLYAARHFEKALARDPDVDVTLVNRENFFLFTPLLHEVAASDLDMTHIVNPIRKLLRRVHFFEGEVEAIDLPTRRVVVSHGFDQHPHELVYDHLVLALGAVTKVSHLQGLEAHALTMRSLGDAMALRDRLIAQLEEADSEGCAHHLQPLLTVVVAGGGFAGVETIAAVNDFLREALACYPHLREDQLRLVLVHAGPVILPELGATLGAYAQRKLAERQVDIRMNTKVTGVSEGSVHLRDGTTIAANTLVWTAGTSPNPLLAPLPCPKEHGRVRVNEDLAVPEWPGVWALGDCAHMPDRRMGTACPPTAQRAMREGKVVAHIQGVNFSGFLAWWLWRTVYLSKLPRFEKKLRVALDWTLDLVFAKDLVQFITSRAPTITYRHEERQPAHHPPAKEVRVV